MATTTAPEPTTRTPTTGAPAARTIEDVILPDSFFSGIRGGVAPGADGLTADDRLAILELVNRFEWSFDAQRLDALAEVLTDDVVIDHLWGYREGKAAALQMMRDNVAGTRGLRHQATNAVVVANGDGTASAVSYLFAVYVSGPSSAADKLPGIAGHAVVTDHCRKENGKWRIMRRTFEQMKTPPGALPDAATERRWQATAAERKVIGGRA